MPHSHPSPSRAGAGDVFLSPASPDTRQPAPPSQRPPNEAGEPSFGAQIRATRLALKLTQRQAAEMLGVTITTLGNWENGRSAPWKKDMTDYLTKLGITAPLND